MRAGSTILLNLIAVLAAVLFSLAPLAADAADRVALVIGNAAYRDASKLKNPRNDAEAITATLERLDFEVIKGVDLEGDALKAVVRDFSRALETAKVALFFYAGHGMQVNGRNFLIPVDAKLGSEADLDFEAMDVKFVLRQMERSNRTNIVLLDACLNNPLAASLARSMGERAVFLGRGLARIDSGVGTIIAFATQPDNVASDGEGQHSPFTAALLDNLETPGLDVELLLRRVRQDVITATNGKQVPWTNSSLVGDRIVLRQPAETEAPATPSQDTPAAATEPAPGANDRDLELAYWASVRDSKNPALLKAYLEKFPDGAFANLARVIIDDLEGGKQAARPKEEVLTPQPIRPPPLQPNATKEQEEANIPPPKQVEPAPPRPQRAIPKLRRAPKPETVIVRPPKREREKPKPRTRRVASERPISRPRPGPPVSAKQCGRCKTCEAMSNACKARWICGRFYHEFKASGFCSS